MIMKFIFESQTHNTTSSTPSRLQRLNRALKRLDIQAIPFKIIRYIDGVGKERYIETPAYSKPLKVKANGTIVEFIHDKDEITLENELAALIERLESGIIDAKTAFIDYKALQDMFNDESSSFLDDSIA